MAKTDNDKSQKIPKSFMTFGPTLHYSHANVNSCYALAMLVYLAAAFFWSKIITGTIISGAFPEHFHLERFVLSPLSIFEYPAQIFVLGLLVAIFISVPILTAQLMSFKYSIFYILVVLLIAKLPGLAVCLTIGSFAVASRPLRFRSRFISIVLCSAPVLLYFAFFGSSKNGDSIKWAMSFSPWSYGFITAIAIAAVVILIGHFTRYRPGLIWSTTALVFIIAVIVFQGKISLAELDYQLYIAKNNPEMIKEFQRHSITEALDETVTKPESRSYFQPPFYPAETIALRNTLKKEIQNRLLHDRWPEWFEVPETLMYQEKKQYLLKQYEKFINPQKQWFKPAFIHKAFLKSSVRTKRMPIALYYKAMLSEFSPELNILVEKETLQFYNDYPNRENLPIWHKLLFEYPKSIESIEARWRRAVHLAGMEKFTLAKQLINQALVMIDNEFKSAAVAQNDELLEGLFKYPPKTVITEFELKKLKRKLEYLQSLINKENLTNEPKNQHLLAQYIILNPHNQYFILHLDNLLEQLGEKSPLIDNILFSQIMLIPDSILRQQRLGQLAKNYPDSDGGIHAKFEQASLLLSIWKEHNLSESEKEKYLSIARKGLESFLKDHPKSIFAEQAKEKLSALPGH